MTRAAASVPSTPDSRSSRRTSTATSISRTTSCSRGPWRWSGKSERHGHSDATMKPIGLVCAYRYMRDIVSVLLVSLSVSLPVAAALPELPPTPAGKVLAGYLDAMNSGNKDKLEAFVKTHRPDRPDALDRMVDLRWNLGGLDVYSIESSQPLSLQAVVREREGNDRYHRMSVTVSGGDPAVITSISLSVIPPPSGAPVPERLTQEAAVAAWKAEID